MAERHHRSLAGAASAARARRCPQCGRVLPLTTQYWHRNRSDPVGFAGWCKDCKNAYRRKRYQPVPPGRVLVNWDSKKRRWTPEEEQTLRDEYPIRSTAVLAVKLRRSELAVRFRAHKLGLGKVIPRAERPDVWANRKEVAGEYRAGASQSALARAYGTSTETIRGVLVAEGCAIRGGRHAYEARRQRVNGELHVRCTKCGKWWPRTPEFFRAQAHSPDGLAAQCKECKREVDRRYLAAHPEKREERRTGIREHHRRVRRALWAARWRLAADQLLLQEDGPDESGNGAG